MPIYEYECEACGHHLEAIQKISDQPLSICPSCHEPALRKLISASGFRLSGSGWYETDFKTKGKRNIAERDSKAPSSDKKTESKSKTETKTKTKTKTASGNDK
ncbi:MAG: zinc ribbon domain-containing protein [Gammaproteobacteria bacterium]|nr:zinc ribbon domain-containing protein [Gammaproteobacteria bacterium]